VPELTVEEVAVGPSGTLMRIEGTPTYASAPRLRDGVARVIRIPSATQVDPAVSCARTAAPPPLEDE